VTNENRYYVVQSLHVLTFARSQMFLDQYRVQHFIKEICKKNKKTKTKADTATIEWLVHEYLSMWKGASYLKIVTGAPPKQCDVFHHLALHVHRLCDWSRHSSPIPHSTWLEFAEQVIQAREKARERNIPWGTTSRAESYNTTQRAGGEVREPDLHSQEVKPHLPDQLEGLLSFPASIICIPACD
jgi:hypothetical protein